jgi:hypothetical protein
MSSYSDRAKTFRIVTVQFHREAQADIVDWLESQPNMKQAITDAVEGHMARDGQANGASTAVDPESIRTVVEEALADHLADVRAVIDSALDSLGSLPREPSPKPPPSSGDDPLARLDAALDIDL